MNLGLVTGCVISGFGLGSLLFTEVCQTIANPDDLKPTIILYQNGIENSYFDQNVANEVPKMLRILAGCYAFLAMNAILFIKPPKSLNSP